MKLNFFKRAPKECTKPKEDKELQLEKYRKRQTRLRAELSRKQKAEFYYFIDIVGACNLRCPSCAVGNYGKSPTPGGQIKLDFHEKILDKISYEHPGETIFIDLYNWGEPGLHKNLAEIISLTKGKGFGVGISSNLNFFPDIKNVLKADPDYIRISLSGYYNEVYQQTHRRGNINIVKSNMHLIRYWLDKLKANTIIEVGFHIYKTNFPNDFLKMESLCHELDFIFAPIIASFHPAEKAIKSIHNELSSKDQELIDKLVITPETRKKIYEPYKANYSDCQFRQHRTAINYDGSVPLCCATYEKKQFVADNFLEIDLKELKKRKYQHPFCKECMADCLHMTFTDAKADKINALAVEELGPIYADFLKEWNKPLECFVEWKGDEYTSQAAYDLALSLEDSDPEQAIDCYKALIKVFPRHGEALYNLGKLLELKEEFEEAAICYKKALKVSPNEEKYKFAFLDIQKRKEELVTT